MGQKVTETIYVSLAFRQKEINPSGQRAFWTVHVYITSTQTTKKSVLVTI